MINAYTESIVVPRELFDVIARMESGVDTEEGEDSE